MDAFHKNSRSIAIAFVLVLFSLIISDQRISVGALSLSVTSLFALFFIALVFGTLTKDRAKTILRSAKTSTNTVIGIAALALLLVSSLIKNTTHGYGVLLEWFLIPSFFLGATLIALWNNEKGTRLIENTLLAVTGLAAITSLLYAVFGIFTFDYRLHGLWPSPNHLGLFLLPVTLLLLPSLGTQTWKHITVIAIITSSVATIVLTKSFAAIGIFVLCSSAYFIICAQRKISARRSWMLLFMYVTAFTILAMNLLLPRIQATLEDFSRSSIASRITIIDVTSNLLRENPVIPEKDTFQEAYLSQQPHYEPFLEWAVPSPHNFYLMLWFTGGWLFFVSSMFLVSSLLFQGISTYVRTKNTYTLAGVVALVAMLLHGIVDTPFFRIDLAYISMLTITFIYLKRKAKN